MQTQNWANFNPNVLLTLCFWKWYFFVPRAWQNLWAGIMKVPLPKQMPIYGAFKWGTVYFVIPSGFLVMDQNVWLKSAYAILPVHQCKVFRCKPCGWFTPEGLHLFFRNLQPDSGGIYIFRRVYAFWDVNLIDPYSSDFRIS